MEKKHAPKALFIPVTGSPRNPMPLAIVRILDALLEGLPEAPSSTRVELRSIRARVARLYKIPLNASATELAWSQHGDEEELP